VEHRCLICKSRVNDFPEQYSDEIDYRYYCPCCGFVALSRQAANYIQTDGLISEKDKSVISICLRDRFERSEERKAKSGSQEGDTSNNDSEHHNRKDDETIENLTVDSLKEIVTTYRNLAPLRKIEHFLLVVERLTKSPGHFADIKVHADYPLFHSPSSYELVSLISFLHKEELIDIKKSPELSGDDCSVMLTTKGLQRLKELTQDDKIDMFMEGAVNLAQKADEEKLKAETERKKALEKVIKYKALIKKITAVSEITISRLKNEEQCKKIALKEIEQLKKQKDKLASELESAKKARQSAEDNCKAAIIEQQKAIAQALAATEEKRTALLIAEKLKTDRQVALERMNAALDAAQREKAEKDKAVNAAIEAQAQILRSSQEALKEKEHLTAELISARQVADNSLFAVKRAEDAKKEAEAVARVATGKVMDAEYKMEKALRALRQAEDEKRDAFKLAYGL